MNRKFLPYVYGVWCVHEGKYNCDRFNGQTI